MSPQEVSFVIEHSKLCALVSELVRAHFSVKASKHPANRRQALDRVDAALADWLIKFPPDLCQQTGWRPSGGPGPWSLLLHLTYNTFLIQVHRPMLSNTMGDTVVPESSADEKMCLDATSNIIQLFEQLIQQSALPRCWFWAPTSLFTALLYLRNQLKLSNPILRLRVNEKYESGMRSLKKLSRHWLFATSVWRLFQSNSIKTAVAPGLAGETSGQISSETDSPQVTVSSIEDSTGQNNTSTATHTDQFQLQDMNWIQPLGSGQSPDATYAMLVERNRWQDSLEDWQSIYWSDPLANIRLPECPGEFQLDWEPSP